MRLNNLLQIRTLSLLFLGLLMAGSAWAEPIPEARAINAIIGEAEGEGYTGMEVLAHAIRNRGTLKGVYGENAPRVKNKLYSKHIYEQAKLAWRVSANTPDLTDGATHWENVSAFGKPYWAKSMVKTVRIGNHQFYRPKQA